MLPTPENELNNAVKNINQLQHLNVRGNVDSFIIGSLLAQDVIHHTLAFSPTYNILLGLTGLAVVERISTGIKRRRVIREMKDFVDSNTERLFRRDQFLDRQ